MDDHRYQALLKKLGWCEHRCTGARARTEQGKIVRCTRMVMGSNAANLKRLLSQVIFSGVGTEAIEAMTDLLRSTQCGSEHGFHNPDSAQHLRWFCINFMPTWLRIREFLNEHFPQDPAASTITQGNHVAKVQSYCNILSLLASPDLQSSPVSSMASKQDSVASHQSTDIASTDDPFVWNDVLTPAEAALTEFFPPDGMTGSMPTGQGSSTLPTTSSMGSISDVSHDNAEAAAVSSTTTHRAQPFDAQYLPTERASSALIGSSHEILIDESNAHATEANRAMLTCVARPQQGDTPSMSIDQGSSMKPSFLENTEVIDSGAPLQLSELPEWFDIPPFDMGSMSGAEGSTLLYSNSSVEQNEYNAPTVAPPDAAWDLVNFDIFSDLSDDLWADHGEWEAPDHSSGDVTAPAASPHTPARASSHISLPLTPPPTGTHDAIIAASHGCFDNVRGVDAVTPSVRPAKRGWEDHNLGQDGCVEGDGNEGSNKRTCA